MRNRQISDLGTLLVGLALGFEGFLYPRVRFEAGLGAASHQTTTSFLVGFEEKNVPKVVFTFFPHASSQFIRYIFDFIVSKAQIVVIQKTRARDRKPLFCRSGARSAVQPLNASYTAAS